jgi:GNAT superfamily N-acetyltransferase
MTDSASRWRVRDAAPADAAAAGRLLHDFNVEFDEPTPPPVELGERIEELLAAEEFEVLLGGSREDEEPEGLAVLRFRPAIFEAALECYLAELYVVPDRRGQGLGRALMEAAIDRARARGATHIDLGTSEADVAARGLYESFGFVNREGGPEGPISYFYEREL